MSKIVKHYNVGKENPRYNPELKNLEKVISKIMEFNCAENKCYNQ